MSGPACLLALALFVLAPRGASAQPLSEYVRSRVEVGQAVWVTTNQEGELLGRVAAISDSRFEVTILGRVAAYPWADIRMLEVADSLKDGTILGGIIGGLALAHLPSPRTAANVTGYALLGAGLGAGAGACVDFLREGRDLIFKNTGPMVRLAPIVLPKTVSLTAVVRW